MPAFEKVIFNMPTLDVDANLSAKQFFCVKMTTTDSRVGLCSSAGEYVDGILQNKPNASGQHATVTFSGASRVRAGGTLTAGDFWGTDANGAAVKVESTNTGADIGKYAMGRVIVGAASGAIATVTIGISANLVESA